MRRFEHPCLIPVMPLPRHDPDVEDAALEAARKVMIEYKSLLADDPYARLDFPATGRILAELVRGVRHTMSLMQDTAGVRVIVIYPADRMNETAANSLLKLLEEPPDRSLLLLLTDRLRDLPQTILSRCQQITMTPLAPEEIAAALTTRYGIDPVRSGPLSRLAGGSLRRARELAEGDLEARLDDGLEFLRSAAIAHPEKLFTALGAWTALDTRKELHDRLEAVSYWIREALIAGTGDTSAGSSAPSGTSTGEVASRMALRYSFDALAALLDEIERTRLAIEANVPGNLALMTLAIKISRMMR